MIVKITPNEKNNPPGKLADAELHFSDGPLDGLKLIGFGIWERRTGGGRNVTFPARQYAVNGERRSFALLRPRESYSGLRTDAQDRIRDLILQAYAEYETAGAISEGTAKAQEYARAQQAPTADGIAYPLVRASRTCPLCNGRKDDGLIVCWTCYRSHDVRNGLTPSDAAIIGHAEAASTRDDTPAAALASTTTAESLFG